MSFPLNPRGSGASNAFTLIELLTVIAIIGVLAGITFGVMGGVKERASISRARTELATLAQALEAYKKMYGDYPQMVGASANYTNNANLLTGGGSSTTEDDDGPGILFNALAGKRGPTGQKMKGKAFVDLNKFTIQDSAELPDASDDQHPNAFVDPWGRRYLYYYKTGTVSQWKQPGYILVSVGPRVKGDGSPGIDVDVDGTYSVPPADEVEAADNIYANRQ